MPRIRCWQVDAFADRPFTGNPAAVCMLTRSLDESLMQSIAAEMNLSEAAFVEPLENGFGLRWFTPVVEVDLCGHATLAAAHALWGEGYVERDRKIDFRTKSGLLTAQSSGDSIQLDFPGQHVEQSAAPPGLLEALGVTAVFYGKSREDALVVVDSEEKLRALTPDFNRLKEFAVRGVIVTCRSRSSSYDFVSRFFAPRCGVHEDPVTGSAHCSLAPYWATVLGKENLIGYQASHLGGVVLTHVRGNRVLLGGQAISVWRGELIIPEEL